MAVATTSGGDGGARVCSRESQGRGWVEEVSEGVPGGCVASPASSRRSAASRRRRGELGGVAVSLLCLLAEVGDDWHQASGLGRAGPGQVSAR